MLRRDSVLPGRCRTRRQISRQCGADGVSQRLRGAHAQRERTRRHRSAIALLSNAKRRRHGASCLSQTQCGVCALRQRRAARIRCCTKPTKLQATSQATDAPFRWARRGRGVAMLASVHAGMDGLLWVVANIGSTGTHLPRTARMGCQRAVNKDCPCVDSRLSASGRGKSGRAGHLCAQKASIALRAGPDDPPPPTRYSGSSPGPSGWQ